ncbi:hypothetical protein AKJ16_DCAP27562 [Drosera capensis]
MAPSTCRRGGLATGLLIARLRLSLARLIHYFPTVGEYNRRRWLAEERSKVEVEFMRPRMSEVSSLKAQLREKDQELKAASDAKFILDAEIKERDEALNLVKADLSFANQLEEALQAWIAKERLKVVGEFKSSEEFKAEYDRGYDEGTENPFLEFTSCLQKYPDCRAIELPIIDLSSCPPDWTRHPTLERAVIEDAQVESELA